MMFLFLFLTIIVTNSFGAEPENGELNFSFDDFTIVNEPPSEEADFKNVNNKNENSKKSFFGFGGKGQGRTNSKSIDEFFDKSYQVLEDIKKIGQESFEGLTNKNKPKKKKKKINPALAFPDPFFYDVVYTKNNQFITLSYVYNDKANKDNLHIPKLKYYDTFKELLSIAKSNKNHSRFYELFDTSRQNKKFDINETDEFGNTLLLTALRNGNFEIFLFLLSQNANPDICNNNNICPIQLAVYSNNLDATKALCDKNVNIKVRDKNGIVVMQYAIYQRQIKIVEILLSRYMKYPVNKSERAYLIEFSRNSGLESLSEEMEKRFQM
jgi:ankyrin repeat protein